jgi:hypothetical protein
MNDRSLRLLFCASSLLCGLALVGCGGGSDGSGDEAGTPVGGKFDRPSDAPEYCAEVACADRLADSMARDFATKNAIRWQCGDVPGVTGPGDGDVDCGSFTDGVKSGEMDRAVACQNNPACMIDDIEAWQRGEFEGRSCVARPTGEDHRGQEYCEYFAIIDPAKINPDAGEMAFTEVQVLGRTTDSENGAPYGFDVDQLSGEQLAWLADEEDPDATVGACVFTSWHWDVEDASRNPSAQNIHGVEVNYDNFRMFGQFNNNGAANALVFDAINGIATAATARQEAGQPAAAHPYWAGCMGMVDCPSGEIQCGGGVEWRVSDPTISAVGTVLAQCGCFAELPDGTKVADARGIANAVVPPNGRYPDGNFLRGFRLGTWDDAEGLPAGCRYVEHDADSSQSLPDTHTLVECDITAGDLANTTNATELKDFCRSKYGDNVVVHVPLPGDIIKCEPPEGAPAYCEGMTPWSMDSVAKTINLAVEDFPADSVCRSSAVGSGESRAGDQLDDSKGPAAK